jgi:mono/diheme cytochrome c family protein
LILAVCFVTALLASAAAQNAQKKAASYAPVGIKGPFASILSRMKSAKATESGLRGEALFFGEAHCAACHAPPYYTGGLLHDLKVERFYKPQVVNGMPATAQGRSRLSPARY